MMKAYLILERMYMDLVDDKSLEMHGVRRHLENLCDDTWSNLSEDEKKLLRARQAPSRQAMNPSLYEPLLPGGTPALFRPCSPRCCGWFFIEETGLIERCDACARYPDDATAYAAAFDAIGPAILTFCKKPENAP